MASSSGSLARTKRRSQSSPELIMMGNTNEEKKTHTRESVVRSVDLSPMGINIIQIQRGDGGGGNSANEVHVNFLHEDPPIPVDAVTLISTDSGGSLACENISIRSTNSLSRNLKTNTDTEKQKGCHIQNGAFAHQEANLITYEYDSSDDSGEDSTKHKQRSRLDQWTNKFRTLLFRGKEKDNSVDDKENRVQEASDSDDDNNCTSDYDKCSSRNRTRSQSFYGCLRKKVRNKECEKVSPPSGKKNKSTFPTTFFPKRSRSRSRNKKSKQSTNLNQPPENMKSEKQSPIEEKNSSPNASGLSHVLTPIEQAELLDSRLPLPAGASEAPGVEVPSPVEATNTIVTQDLYGQFGSHTQNGYIPRTVHTQIDYIHCLVPKLKCILDKPCYWGKIDRYQADALLENKPEGTYLLRDSAQEEFLFSVSFRRYSRSLHARLEQWSHRFSFDAHDPGVYSSDTVTGLLEHYKDPNCCMFFEPMLTTPLPRPNPHTLKELCRGVVCSNITYDDIHCLKIPQMFKEYLREYHYKQRVRVRRFEIDYVPQQSGRRQTVTNTCISY